MNRLSTEYVTLKDVSKPRGQEGWPGSARTGSDLAVVAMEHVFLMCSHLGRLLCVSFHGSSPHPAVLSTCPLLHGVLARHGEAISSLGSSVKEIESRVERGQSSHRVCLLGT